LYEAYIKGKGR